MTSCTVQPIAVQVQEAYELNSLTYVNLCSMSFTLCSIPFTLVSIWAFEKFNLATVLRCCIFIQLSSMLIRDISILNDQFWPHVVGSFFAASVDPFFLIAQVTIVNRWFPAKQRALALGLLVSSMVLGNFLGYTITGSVFASKDVEDATQVKEGLQTVLLS